jgi:hypothetical protein
MHVVNVSQPTECHDPSQAVGAVVRDVSDGAVEGNVDPGFDPYIIRRT